MLEALARPRQQMHQKPGTELRSTAPLWVQPLRWAAYLSVVSYYHSAYRIRGWGNLPRQRGSSLLVINHAHDIESGVVVATLGVKSFSWRYPIFTVSSRRMWEPGFFAQRISWLRLALRGLNFGWLFSALGMQPIENELHARPLSSISYMLERLRGNLPVDSAFREPVLERLPPTFKTLSDVWSLDADAAAMKVTLSDLREPYRSESLAATRAQLDADLAHFENLARDGATIFLAPEAFYTLDGKMQRLRGILPRLAPFCRSWPVGISYDPFVGRRLSMLYRVVSGVDGVPLDIQLKRTRPVTVSALLGSWLHGGPAGFSERDALEAVLGQLRQLPPGLFVDPDLRYHPEAMVKAALAGMTRLGMLERAGGRHALTQRRSHPQFPHTPDMIAYQFNFHEETLAGARFREDRQSA